MAQQSHWDIDPTDERAIWLKVIGHDQEDLVENQTNAANILQGTGHSCLEIGAGVGRLLRYASQRYNQAYGVDYSASLVSVSKQYLKYDPRCSIQLTDGIHLPFPDNFFDFVYSFTCFQHMPTIDIVRSNLKEAYRVLRTGGRFRVQTVEGHPDPGRYDGIVFPSPAAFWKELEEVGFSFVESHSKDSWIWLTGRRDEEKRL